MDGKTLTLHWQRLLTGGATCPRCGSTEQAVEEAAATLTQALAPLGIAMVLEKGELTPEAFARAPLQSNRILLNGRSLEDWLGASSGQSPCCAACGPHECRTLEIGDEVYEAVPAALIVKAGLLAAAEISGRKGCGCAPATGAPDGGGCVK